MKSIWTWLALGVVLGVVLGGVAAEAGAQPGPEVLQSGIEVREEFHPHRQTSHYRRAFLFGRQWIDLCGGRRNGHQ